jgi:capsular polysaccharide biosynthesis protein
MDKQSTYHEIDLKELFSVLLDSKKLILFFIIISATASYFYASSQVNLFKSSALLEVVNNSQSNTRSGLSSYASLVGVNITSSETNKPALVLATVKSKDFFKNLINNEEIYIGLTAAKSFDKNKGLIYDKSIFNQEEMLWLKNKKPSFLKAFQKYKNSLTVNIDNKTGFMNVTVEHISPIFAKKLIDSIVLEVNRQFKEKNFQESSNAIDYLEQKLQTTLVLETRNSINQLISSNLEKLMLADINKDYMLRYIENAYVPENKSRPNKPLITILGTIIGFFFSIIFVLIRHYSYRNTSLHNEVIS